MRKTTWSSKPKILTILTGLVIRELVSVETQSNRTREMYQRLQKVVRTARNSSYTLVTDDSTFILCWYTNSNETQAVVGKTGMFAVVDSSLALQLFREMLTVFGDYKSAKPHNSMSFYWRRIVWFVQNNFFANLFATGLTSMVESGIYGRWFANGNIHRPLLQFYNTHKMKYRRRDKIIYSEFEATSIAQVSVPFYLLLAMELGSVAIFLHECKHAIKMCLWSAIICVKSTIVSHISITARTKTSNFESFTLRKSGSTIPSRINF